MDGIVRWNLTFGGLVEYQHPQGVLNTWESQFVIAFFKQEQLKFVFVLWPRESPFYRLNVVHKSPNSSKCPLDHLHSLVLTNLHCWLIQQTATNQISFIHLWSIQGHNGKKNLPKIPCSRDFVLLKCKHKEFTVMRSKETVFRIFLMRVFDMCWMKRYS